MNFNITVIGAGLAGCEAAWAAANRGLKVQLLEMKPAQKTPAHKSNLFAELVCSNSLKALRLASAAGLLKAEMRLLGSLCLTAAETCTVPAGGALAVERNAFSAYITQKIKSHPNITVQQQTVTSLPQQGVTVVATGPLTEGALAADIARLTGQEYLSFYDAAAPIVSFESVDMGQAFFASRYGKGNGDDYINCPLDKVQYTAFRQELITAERALLHDFEKKREIYEGCMPIEVLAARGEDAIRFGPMKPVGLTNPATGHRPWAVLQLRREDPAGNMYNLVGFQTNLKFGEQKRVFSMIPALKKAEFLRYGVMHRNSFIQSPKLLAPNLALRQNGNVFFAGQLSGVEGYMESAASGILCGINAAAKVLGKPPLILPQSTMIGALLHYITTPREDRFEPMGANFGILPKPAERIKNKTERYTVVAEQALAELKQALKGEQLV